jgi:rubredoxin
VPCYTDSNKNVAKNRRRITLKYVCDICGWVYDEAEGAPDHGIPPGTKWDDLPDDFVCLLCGVDKDNFSKEG